MAKKQARKKSVVEGRDDEAGSERRAEGRAEADGGEDRDREGGRSTSTSSAARRTATDR